MDAIDIPIALDAIADVPIVTINTWTINLPALKSSCSTPAGIPILNIDFWVSTSILNGNILLIDINSFPLNKALIIIIHPIILAIAIDIAAPVMP